jgi:hypothetical protein
MGPVVIRRLWSAAILVLIASLACFSIVAVFPGNVARGDDRDAFGDCVMRPCIGGVSKACGCWGPRGGG